MSCCQIEILSHDSEIDQLRKELVLARSEAGYYKSLHERDAQMRERIRCKYHEELRVLRKKYTEEVGQLHELIAKLKAKVKLRERQLFGKKSERNAKSEKSESKNPPQRNRGQQNGTKSPPRRKYTHLSVREELHELPESERLCPCCQAPYADLGTSEDSDLVEIDVDAYTRRIKRKKYRRTCQCHSRPVILTASNISKLFAKSRLGNSIWTHCLLQKFWHGQPLHRIIQSLTSQGLSIPIGTLVGGFLRLLPLFRRVYQAIVDKSLTDRHWHADETGWKVFESLEGKANNRWFLWVFKSNSAAVFINDPSRSAKVVQSFFGKNSQGIISCDRYRAYFCFISKSENRFKIAYCWAHVRRDFLAIAKDWPLHEAWAMQWVEQIRELYQLNEKRFSKQSEAYEESQEALAKGLKAFQHKANEQLESPLAEPCRKVLESLNRHWTGLTTFLEHPEVPMDNNAAERSLRGGAVGRKNYYGSGSVESAELTAMMFTMIQTLLIGGINPQEWFSGFFDFMGDEWDKDFDSWLPWKMSEERRAKISLKRSHDPPQ